MDTNGNNQRLYVYLFTGREKGLERHTPGFPNKGEFLTFSLHMLALYY